MFFSWTFYLVGSYISTHLLYMEYHSCDIFLMSMQLFLRSAFFPHILHDTPLNYSHISFEYTFNIQDALGFVIEMYKRVRFGDSFSHRKFKCFFPDLLISRDHISVLIYYIWSTIVAIFFVWVCNFFLRSAFFSHINNDSQLN